MSFALSSCALSSVVGGKRASVTGGRLGKKTTAPRRAAISSLVTRAAVGADKQGALKPFEVRFSHVETVSRRSRVHWGNMERHHVPHTTHTTAWEISQWRVAKKYLSDFVSSTFGTAGV